ncbi:MAG: glycosyltransferase [Desulfobacteraceae bacterium]|nr:MAG: glycosyltransferase [Desulfobacteraceae bacterium]
MLTSLIVTTYNWPEALQLVLQSVIVQSVTPDEVVIADDGSGPETAHVVRDTLGSTKLRWAHVRHADRGVRQSRIKNLAVKFSAGDYLIFVDHDVVLHPCFVEDHLSMACPGSFLQGKRVLLDAKFTGDAVSKGFFRAPTVCTRGLGNRKNGCRLPYIGKLLARPKEFERSLRGCNLSLFRDDFIRVDGFDETFDGSWGREDSDICYRLFHAGVSVRTLWFMALQYHLFHQVVTNWERARLDSELERNLSERRTRAVKGFSCLSSEGGLVAGS